MTSIAPAEIVDTVRVSPETTIVGLESCTKKTLGIRNCSAARWCGLVATSSWSGVPELRRKLRGDWGRN